MDNKKYLANVQFLIVDDSAFMRTIIRRILSTLGVQKIREANDGSEGLKILQNWSPDIILAAWEMSPFDVIEFTRTIRQSSRGDERFTPIIMLSAHSEYWRIQQARNAGVNEFLVKPVSPKSLFSRIRAVIRRPRQFIKAPGYFGPDRRRQDMGHSDEKRKSQSELIPVPAEQVMQQNQINALFNPGSEHPEEQAE